MMSKPHLIRGTAQKQQTIEYLNETEYYTGKDGKPQGEAYWHGGATRDLGLANKAVNAKDLSNLLEGFSRHGKKLTKNAGTETREKHGWDCPNSVPKSVSLLFAFSSPEQREKIMRAVETANRESIQFLETQMTVRTGHGGETLEKCHGLAVASFVHYSSRELDAQIHCHNVITNLGKREDGSYGSLDGRELFENFHAAGGVFRSALAKELSLMGFECEPDRSGKSFDIKSFSGEMLDGFSQSRKKMLAWLDKHGKSARDQKALDLAQRFARQKKQELPLNELEYIWEKKGEEYGLDRAYVASIPKQAQKQDAREKISAEEILAEITEQKSTFTRKEVFAKVASKAAQCGGLRLSELEAATDRILSSQEAIELSAAERKQGFQRLKSETRYTTGEMLRAEAKLFQDFKNGWDDKETHKRGAEQIARAKADYERAKSEEIGKPVKMTAEQEAALNHIASGGRQVLIQGYSGTGKSFTMGAVRQLEEAAGQTVIGCALAGKAASGLGEGAGIKDSRTIDSLLLAVKNGRITPSKNHTIIVDEAAMVGSKKIRALQEAFSEAKIVYLGDFQQYQAIEAGGWMLALQKSFDGATAKLTDITRQKGWHRDAIEKIIGGDGAEALKMFEANGKAKALPTHLHIVEKIADDYMADGEQMKEKLVMCSTHRATREINSAIRKRLIEAGKLGKKGYVATLTEKGYDTPDIDFERELRQGDRLRFTNNNAALRVMRGDGGEIADIRQLRGGDIELAIKHDNGRTVKLRLSEYNHFEHGYARTGHSSQGATVNRSFVYADADAADMSALYVLLSRSRDKHAEQSGNTTLYATTDDMLEPPKLGKDGKPIVGADGQPARQKSALARAIERTNYKDTSVDYLDSELIEAIAANPEAGIAALRERKAAAAGQQKASSQNAGTAQKSTAAPAAAAQKPIAPVISMR